MFDKLDDEKSSKRRTFASQPTLNFFFGNGPASPPVTGKTATKGGTASRAGFAFQDPSQSSSLRSKEKQATHDNDAKASGGGKAPIDLTATAMIANPRRALHAGAPSSLFSSTMAPDAAGEDACWLACLPALQLVCLLACLRCGQCGT